MENALNWGVQVILWLQQASPALDLPFIALTTVGTQEILLAAGLFVFWCVDRRAGARLAVLLLLSAWLNTTAKDLAAQPRPFEWDSRVRMIVLATGGGLPSGHTQSMVVFFGYLALTFRRRWLALLAAAMMVLVPLSRLYLGVHFPTDLLGGYLLGGALLWLYRRLEPALESWLAQTGMLVRIALGALAALALAVIHPAAGENLWSGAGMLAGLGVGISLERRLVGWEPAGPWRLRVLGWVVGVAVALILLLGLKAAFEGLLPEELWRTVRYAIIGLWAGLGTPWLLMRLTAWREAGRK